MRGKKLQSSVGRQKLQADIGLLAAPDDPSETEAETTTAAGESSTTGSGETVETTTKKKKKKKRTTTTTEAPACADGWTQCGGGSWAGPSCCIDGYTCNQVDKYYAQCVPNEEMEPDDPAVPNGPKHRKTQTTTTTSSTTPFPIGPDGCTNDNQQCAGGPGYTGSTCCIGGLTCKKFNPTDTFGMCVYTLADSVPEVYKGEGLLSQKSSAPLYTFYMYRAMAQDDTIHGNVNAATLGGVIWYLHNEVVWQTPRKFAITKIMRIKVKTRAPQPLFQKGMNFGVRYAFDSGMCTGPYSCDKQYFKYGYFVGCNVLGNWPFPDYPVAYVGNWYSLPGPCNSKRHFDAAKFTFDNKTCAELQPGGLCTGAPTGVGNCTWSWEDAGQISVDELEGITNYEAFIKAGNEEYNKTTDVGKGLDFWNNINDTKKAAIRVKKASDLFAKHYPNLPRDEDLPPPPCDFDTKKFYS